jgi:hypothetical protein
MASQNVWNRSPFEHFFTVFSLLFGSKDPDPHYSEKEDPDPHQIDADPQHWLRHHCARSAKPFATHALQNLGNLPFKPGLLIIRSVSGFFAGSSYGKAQQTFVIEWRNVFLSAHFFACLLSKNLVIDQICV